MKVFDRDGAADFCQDCLTSYITELFRGHVLKLRSQDFFLLEL